MLEAKEAVSLINGTQAMLAVGTLALMAAEILVDSADVIGALTLRCAARGQTWHLTNEFIELVRMPGKLQHCRQSTQTAGGQRDPRVASRLRPSAGCLFAALHPASPRRSARHAGLLPRGVRGRDELGRRQSAGVSEQRSPTRNRNDQGDVISGGNFHGEPVAFALDFLGIALSALAGI